MNLFERLYLQVLAIEKEFDVQVIPVTRESLQVLKQRIYERVSPTAEAERRYQECARRMRDCKELPTLGRITEPVRRDRILFVASNPNDQYRIRTDKEFAFIKSLLDGHPEAQLQLLMPELATSPTGFRDALVEQQPALLHFAGHGMPEGLIFENERGNSDTLSKADLQRLFYEHQSHLQIAVLNACFSAILTEGLFATPETLVSCRCKTIDAVALAFTEGFYKHLTLAALEGQRDTAAAFAAGCSQLHSDTGYIGTDIYQILSPP